MTFLMYRSNNEESVGCRHEKAHDNRIDRRGFAGTRLRGGGVRALRIYRVLDVRVFAVVQPRSSRLDCRCALGRDKEMESVASRRGVGAYCVLRVLQFHEFSRPYEFCGRDCVRGAFGIVAESNKSKQKKDRIVKDVHYEQGVPLQKTR